MNPWFPGGRKDDAVAVGDEDVQLVATTRDRGHFREAGTRGLLSRIAWSVGDAAMTAAIR